MRFEDAAEMGSSIKLKAPINVLEIVSGLG
jgi:hypothetical protein